MRCTPPAGAEKRVPHKRRGVSVTPLSHAGGTHAKQRQHLGNGPGTTPARAQHLSSGGGGADSMQRRDTPNKGANRAAAAVDGVSPAKARPGAAAGGAPASKSAMVAQVAELQAQSDSQPAGPQRPRGRRMSFCVPVSMLAGPHGTSPAPMPPGGRAGNGLASHALHTGEWRGAPRTPAFARHSPFHASPPLRVLGNSGWS